MPVILVLQDASSGGLDFKGAMSLHTGGHLVFFFSKDDQKKFQNGLRVGGFWDSVLGGGAQIGWVGDLHWDRLSLGFGAGLQIYPAGAEKARDHFNLVGAVEMLELMTTVQPYVGLNLGWYLL